MKRTNGGSPERLLRIWAPIILLAAAGGAAVQGKTVVVFQEEFRQNVWKSHGAASVFRLVEDNGARALRWSVTTNRDGRATIYAVQRDLPVRVPAGGELHFRVRCDKPAAIEVQFARPGEPRAYHCIDLRGKEATVDIPLSRMGSHAGFRPTDWDRELALRFWIDDNPNWVNGTIREGETYTFTISDLSITNPLAALPEGFDALLEIDPDRAVARVHPNVYGHFLEHIYHSVVNGLWGEQIQNLSFGALPMWCLEGGVLKQNSGRTDVTTQAGSRDWEDYDFELEARKTGGREGFLILFRAVDADSFYWWNLGGWGNKEHALEVERAGQRSIAGSRQKGSIETGRWCRIRVRVRGKRIQGWLDGEKLLDVEDATHASGCVGVGTWQTQAEFRNMKVTDPDGNVLWRGPEGMGFGRTAPELWAAVDEGDKSAGLRMVDNGGQNSDHAIELKLPGDEAWHGIVQRGIYVRSGLKYTGWARLRSTELHGAVRVQLLTSKGEVLGEKTFGKIGAEWEKCEFEFAPAKTDTDARLSVCAAGSGSLQIDVVSLFSSAALATGGFRPDLLEAVRELHPPIIRWPGGCFASIYRWRRSIGPPWERRPFYNVPWGYWDDAQFGVDEFIRLCRRVNAEPLIVLNIGSWDMGTPMEVYLREALDWIEYCNGGPETPMGSLRARNGHPEPYNVTHWELDNETWAMTVDGYAKRLAPFAREIRKRWPKLKLYACSFWVAGDPSLLKKTGSDIDYLSYHLYDNPDRYATGPAAHEMVWRIYEKIIAASPNPKLKLAVTEWNAQSTDWRTGLFAAGLLMVFERLEVVEMGSPALFLRRTDATAWDNAFINHDNRRWFPAPNYVVMKLFSEHYLPLVVSSKCVGALDTIVTRDEEGESLVVKVVNPGPKPCRTHVDLGGFKAQDEAEVWTVKADGLRDRNTLERPDKISPVRTQARIEDDALPHTFPPYSVTVIRFGRR